MEFKSIYVHIPFCLRKCNYCDFISFPIADYSAEARRYFSYLDKETTIWISQEDLSQAETVYFGGGTPTVLALADILHIISRLLAHCRLGGGNEVSLECNPGTIDAKGLFLLRKAGVNRLSIGAESFSNKSLKAMGRQYTAEACEETVKNALKAGFDNISLDLIYGLPQQTVKQWERELKRALSLDVKHISLYGLTLSDKTPWGKAAAQGHLLIPDEDLSAEMLEKSIKTVLRHGFAHYEISNFAKPGYECRHNLGYWQRKNYLGLGVSAAGAVGNHRFSNYRTLKQYEESLNNNCLPQEEEEILNRAQVLAEAMFLGLRILKGINMEEFARRYLIHPLEHFQKQIAENKEKGLLEQEGEYLRLTYKGLFLANEVFMSFL
jgi:oxygen-independent coproporphyrinogen-3 oxidase